MKNGCIFCAIAEGEIPSFKVYEDDIALAYLDINPFAKGHNTWGTRLKGSLSLAVNASTGGSVAGRLGVSLINSIFR